MRGLGRQFHFDRLFKDSNVGTSINYSGINLYQLGDLSCISGYEVLPHKQWCHEITYIISGEGILTTDNETKLLMEGYVHFAPAGSIHAIQTTKSDLRFAYIGFDFDNDIDDKDILALKEFFENTKIFSASNCRELLVLLTQNLDEIYSKSEFYDTMISAYLKQILITVYRAFVSNQSTTYFEEISANSTSTVVSSVLNYVNEHIYEKIKVQDICNALGYTPSYISVVFKKETGLTVQRYINNLKMQKAIELMQHGKISETQVAVKLGYADLQTFNKAFRRTMGTSPMKFIEKAANASLSEDTDNEKRN